MRINSYRPQTYLGGGEQKNSTAQQYTNATQNDPRSQMRSHAIRAHRKESFAVHRADTSSLETQTAALPTVWISKRRSPTISQIKN